MFKNKKIKAYEIGLVYENNKLIKVFQEGKYYIKAKEKIEVFSMLAPFYPKMDLSILLQNNELKNLLNVIEVNDNEIGLVYKDKLFQNVLQKGVYAFWKEPLNYSFEIYNKEELLVPDAISKSVLQTPYILSNIRVFEVLSNEKGLLFVNDELKGELNAGTFYFWKNATKVEVKKIDIRQQSIELLGQEILTSDKANLRINFNANFKVIDVKKALVENKDYVKQLYTGLQMKIREYVGNMSLDELLVAKEKIGDYIINQAKTEADSLGVKLVSSGIKDIILPGDMKEIMNQVLIAQKKAQANMITRKEETAATRSLLNTARLMEDNEMLFKLKEMEYVEKIADKIGEITVSGNGNVIGQLKDIFSVNK